MTRSGNRHRHSWEYAEGPDVGSEMAVTSEPRSEEKPGVPAALPDGDGERAVVRAAGLSCARFGRLTRVVC